MLSTPITDALLAVIGSESHASSPSKRAGGEWDAWRSLHPRQRRRLIGARYATKGGMPPDELADLIARRRGLDDYRAALEWFYRNALLAIKERRAAANRARHERLARKSGHQSYYRRRVDHARCLGANSLWDYRKQKGWPENRTPPWRPRS